MAVAPLRNLTGDAEQQCLVEGFTDQLVTGLFRHCRVFSFAWLAGEPRWAANRAAPNPSELKYVISGSVQRGSSQGMLRVNIRISEAATANYLWAARQEFRPEHLAQIRTEITPQISRALHTLLLHEASHRAYAISGAELGVNECLARGEAALKRELCAELSVEAQQWFLAAHARDPRNVEALFGLALTCQHLVSKPWWGDPRAAAAASDLGREAVTIALEFEPGNARVKTIQGMLYSAAGQLEEGAWALRQALAMDQDLDLRMGSQDIMPHFSGVPGTHCLRSNELCTSIGQIGGTVSSSATADLPNCCSAGRMKRSSSFRNRWNSIPPKAARSFC